MKKAFLLSLLLTLLLQGAVAQDVILKINGEEIPAKVLEITLEAIRYKLPADSLSGPTRQVARSEVFMIRYANGTKELFSENLPENQAVAEQQLPSSPQQMYLRGQDEARRFYRGNGALWGSAASSVLFPYGLAGAVVIGAVPPRPALGRVSDPHLLLDPNFVRGYQKQAHRRKVGKVAIGAGIGTVTVLTAAMVLILSSWN